MTSKDQSLRVVVADDQATVREGLVLMLDLLPDISVVASASNGQEAINAVEEYSPDVLLLDLHMPVLDGIETTRRLSQSHASVAIVILTTYVDDTSVLAALRAGARGYLTKDADRADIAGALHAAARGMSVLDPSVQSTLLGSRELAQPAPRTDTLELPDGLTPREAEILGLISAGATNAEIAQTLVVSSHTVKSHINRIFAKTSSRDRQAAVMYAHDHGLSRRSGRTSPDG